MRTYENRKHARYTPASNTCTKAAPGTTPHLGTLRTTGESVLLSDSILSVEGFHSHFTYTDHHHYHLLLYIDRLFYVDFESIYIVCAVMENMSNTTSELSSWAKKTKGREATAEEAKCRFASLPSLMTWTG